MKSAWKTIPRTAVLTWFLMLLSATLLPAYAADSREKISSVRLNVSYEEKPEAGKTPGTVTVSTSDERIEIPEPAQYYDTDDTVWIRGEVPVIRVELAIKDKANHRFASSTKVTVSGKHSEVKTKKLLDNGDGLRIDIRLPRVSGPLKEAEDLCWDGKRARWSEIEGADQYEVRLYRGSSQVAAVTTANTSYNFYPHMNRGGEYTFRVRGINRSDGTKGSWTDKSEEFYLTSQDAYQGSVPNSDQGNTPSPGWNQSRSGWTYRKEDGSLTQDSWLFTDNQWFYFGNDSLMRTGWIFVDQQWFYLNPVSDGTKGAMKTGWIFADNHWFYLNPVSDGTKGAMKTGWIFADSHWFYLNPVSDGTKGAMKTGWTFVDNGWYYLNPVSDGTRGAMKTGYEYINGKWHYLDKQTGILWTNRQTPDGRFADRNGALSAR